MWAYILHILNLRDLCGIQVESPAFKGELWVGDADSGVISINMVSKPVGTDEVTPRKSMHREKGKGSMLNLEAFQHIETDKAENSLPLIPLTALHLHLD